MKRKFKFKILTRNTLCILRQISHNASSSSLPLRNFHAPTNPNLHYQAKAFAFPSLSITETARFIHSIPGGDQIRQFDRDPDNQSATEVQQILENFRASSAQEIELALDQCGLVLSDDLVLNVLHQNQFDWKLAFVFFKWVSKGGCYSPGSIVYNEILDVLGKMQVFDELIEVLDEMSRRKGLLDEKTFEVLLNRYAAARKVEEAIEVYKRRKQFGIENDLVAFQALLTWLCRYKLVEVAETLFCSKQNEFPSDIKIRNIILNGWCVLGNVREAKRFWKDILSSGCKPDLWTHGTFINALTKRGKLGTAMKLFRSMLDKGYNPDVVICNCIIDALCFKKRIPEALQVFREMRERGCLPNAATYNSLIKHLCKIRRMDKVYELLHEMEQKKGSCLPNEITYSYLLKSLKRPGEVPEVLERMERNECSMTGDIYNLILKLYVDWDLEEKVGYTWDEMEKAGLGPDRRSYTILIHWLHEKGKIEDALYYFNEMISKGMVLEPRTEILVNDMNTKLKEREQEKKIPTEEDKSRRSSQSKRNKLRNR